MKKFILATIFLCIFSLTYVSASDIESTKTNAKSELTEIYKLYDDYDYTDENWLKLVSFYNDGISNINASTSSAAVYNELNAAAENMISVTSKYRSVSACISIENLVLEKGFIIFPQTVKIRKYQRVSKVITDLIEKKSPKVRNPYYMNGSIENNFELTGVYTGYSTSIDDPSETDPAIYLYPYVGRDLPEPSDRSYLKSGDYTSNSCFVYSVNNKFPNVYASAIPVLEDDVIRVQFSLYGNGADLGADTHFSDSPIISSPDKTKLYLKFSDINSNNDLTLLLSNKENAENYNNALAVAEIVTISQTAIDKAIKKLNSISPVIVTPPTADEPNDTDNDNDVPETTPPVITPSDPTEQPKDTDDTEIDTPAEDKSENAIIFSDLTETHFAKEAIDYLSSKGILNGNPDGTFGIDDIITRGQFAAILARCAGYTNKDVLPFTDISQDDWFFVGVSFCYTNNISNGQSETIFNPNAPITRQDLATMLYRFINYKEINLNKTDSDSFADLDLVADYAKEAVLFLKQAQLINGRGDGNFAPTDLATRSETAKILYSIIK